MPVEYRKALAADGAGTGAQLQRVGGGVRRNGQDHRLPRDRSPRPELPAGRRAAEALPRVHHSAGRRGHARAGGALHGLRHSLLSQRLPGEQPDPGLERPRLQGRLAEGAEEPSLDQQLPGIHRPHLPRPVRGELHAEHPGHPGHHQDRSSAPSSTRAGRGLDHARRSTRTRPARRSPSIGSGPAGMACAQQLARAGHDVHLYEKNARSAA